ncbi:spore-associated protein A [Streptomyces zingiberis]|uniref:Spore-associated protein A n=1 Tax=Streptomyces zingiberis TaxID=2053010 RepID=A0ABX1BZH3_9ACTN|nr:spore-associated protein A [Streptomyces zingiberis]NJQ01865.1 spore-associated protein A [Streptomyces zingiberis]
MVRTTALLGSPARTAAAGAAAVTLAAAGVLATAAPASAANYNGACGSGYTLVDSAPVRTLTGTTLGVLFLTYNTSNGYKCAVTVSNVGRPVPMAVGIKRSSAGTWVFDKGTYTSYAGPVYTYARGQCVDFDGVIDSARKRLVNTNCK